MSGWIKLHRKFLNWEWYTKDNMAHLFIHLILSANHRPTKWRGKTIERGQLLTGRRKLAESTGLTERSVRTCLNLLKSTNEIAIKTTSKFSIITVVNYEEYQKQDEETTSKMTIDQSNDRPSTDQVPTTSKNVKKKKNTKKRRINPDEKTSGVKKRDFISEVITEWQDAFKLSRGADYIITTTGKEKDAAGKIVNLNKKMFPDHNSDEALISIRAMFDMCLQITDPWLYENMSMTTIYTKFNVIKTKLNGNSKNKKGVTNAELAEVLSSHFNDNGKPF